MLSSKTILALILHISVFCFFHFYSCHEPGMFPYVMLATTSIFFYPDWPKRLLQKLPSRISSLLPSIHPPAPSEHCIYPQTVEKAKKQQLKGKDKQGKDILPLKQSTTAYHNLGALCFILFTICQVFLPYSHFVTQVRKSSFKHLQVCFNICSRYYSIDIPFYH